MSTQEKMPAIYIIRNKTDGKVYIGSTKDVQGRFKRYMWSMSKLENGKTCPHPMVNIIYQSGGWDNFEFDILEYGRDLFDNEYRGLRETYYIMKYRSIDERFGYNATIGGESGAWGKMDKFKIKKARTKYSSLILYDIVDNAFTLCFFGWRNIAKLTDLKEASIITNIKRGALMCERYYAFYVNRENRTLILEYVREYRCGYSAFSNGGNSEKSRRSFESYYRAYQLVEDYLTRTGMSPL